MNNNSSNRWLGADHNLTHRNDGSVNGFKYILYQLFEKLKHLKFSTAHHSKHGDVAVLESENEDMESKLKEKVKALKAVICQYFLLTIHIGLANYDTMTPVYSAILLSLPNGYGSMS